MMKVANIIQKNSTEISIIVTHQTNIDAQEPWRKKYLIRIVCSDLEVSPDSRLNTERIRQVFSEVMLSIFFLLGVVH